MEKQRILSIDILRGITVAAMIIFNDAGGPESFAMLRHAEWIGLTPTDFAFPFFMFIMGITTYLSLRKFQFRWSWTCARKVAKRALLLWFFGMFIAWLVLFTSGMTDPANAALPLGQRLWLSINTFDHVRILGVLPRLGICYGLAAVIALTWNHKVIPWLVAVLFIGYYIILELGNGYAHDATNVLDIFDRMVMGAGHCYAHDTPDPEGILSTLPALGHVLIGFWVGEKVMNLKTLDEKIERLFIYGSVLLIGGALLSYGCPVSKKLWTPTFAMVTCGFCSLSLALLMVLIDKRHYHAGWMDFFHVFGVNPLALYMFSELMSIPLGMVPSGDASVQTAVYGVFASFLAPKAASLAWALLYVGFCWLLGLWLYRKKIYIKL